MIKKYKRVKKRIVTFLKKNEIVQKTFSVVFGTLIAFFLIEVILRTFPHTTLRFYDTDIFGSALVPNQKGWFVSSKKEYQNWVETNSGGWTDIEHAYEKPEGIKRVLIIGDSFVENFQAPFEKRFFRQLQGSLGPKYEVIVMGRGNTGTGPQYLILKNYGLRYKPDLVIHMFFVANDVKNNSKVMQNDPFLPYFTIGSDGNLVQVPFAKRSLRNLAGIKEFLTDFRLIELLLSIRHSRIEAREASKFGYPIDYHVYDKNYLAEYSKAWEVTKKLILETKKEAENSGSKYVLVAIPGNEQVHKDVLEKIIETYPEFSHSEVDLTKPDRILKGFCANEKLECYFMLPYFQEYLNLHPESRLYYFYDGHWNQTGTDLVAKFLYEKLIDFIK